MKQGGNGPSLALEVLLRPVASIYGFLTNTRNLAFEHGWRKVIDPGVPVISIGNLTAGGTGKTPVTALLTAGFRARGQAVGIVSRGYGGREKGPARVATTGDTVMAQKFGDEPTWLAARFPDVPVYIAANRVEAVRALMRENKVDLVIADDAFQHRKLARQFDIVILDALEPDWHYRMLPLGRLRESFSSLKRADAIFITKANLAEPAQRERLRRRIDDVFASSSKRPPIYEIDSALSGFMKLDKNTEGVIPARGLEGKKVVLASGIGRPESFERLMVKDAKVQIADHLVFADHHRYSKTDFERITARVREIGAESLVVTEKDAVKMTGWSPDFPCWITKLEARGSLEGLYEALDRRLF